MQELENMKTQNVEELFDVDLPKLTSEVKNLENQLISYESQDPYIKLIDPNYSVNELLYKGKDTQLSFSIPEYLSNKNKESENKLTYELYYSQEQQNDSEIEQLLELERRITKLENITGINSHEDIQNEGLIERVLSFDKKISCLDDQTLSYLSQKVQQLTQDLMLYSKSKDSLALQVQSEYGKKIEKLSESSEIIDVVSNQLPIVIDRLIQLKDIHEENANFSINVETLFKEQEKINSLVSDQKEFLSKVEKNLIENIGIIKSNIDILQNKINLIEKI